jgi:hypothetical protein
MTLSRLPAHFPSPGSHYEQRHIGVTRGTDGSRGSAVAGGYGGEALPSDSIIIGKTGIGAVQWIGENDL